MSAESDEETSETDAAKQRTPLSMIVPAGLLVLGAVVIGVVPDLGRVLEHGAVQLEDQGAYAATVLGGTRGSALRGILPTSTTSITAAGIVTSVASAAGAALLALGALFRERLPLVDRYRPSRRVRQLAETLQSGVVNDYVTWLVLGIACLGGAFALIVR